MIAEPEANRPSSLFATISSLHGRVLDIGGGGSRVNGRLSTHFTTLDTLDIRVPQIKYPLQNPVLGDLCALDFEDNTFDLVLCIDILEHIPTNRLQNVCAEISRVAKGTVVIAVPYKQDIRVGRATCAQCGTTNPPYAHVNVFDEQRLQSLFPVSLRLTERHYFGEYRWATNPLAVKLLDFAGNPYGDYHRPEPCVKCFAMLTPPGPRNGAQRAATKIATLLNSLQSLVIVSHPKTIHAVFAK
jgi:hypothetical protein